MKRLRFLFIMIYIAGVSTITAQENQKPLEETFTFQSYLTFVKQHHPVVKQAELTLKIGEANLLKARGGFDPKIEVDYDRKKFKGTEYYDQLNTTFKIPTWYGVEFKANFEENSGSFLNPSMTVPENGLYSAGVTLSLAQGLLINDRMASLKKAKYFTQQTQAERNLLVNELLYQASIAYFEWLEATNEVRIYETFLSNARTRFDAVVRSVEEGDKAAIDITEARIQRQNYELNLEAAKLKMIKTTLNVSNYLWIDGVPVEVQDNLVPVLPSLEDLETSLLLEDTVDTSLLEANHPKIQSLSSKINALLVDRALKRNKLLPKVDLQYNFLSQEYNVLDSFKTANYKAFVNVSFPLFLRKERGDVQLANLKLEEATFERTNEKLRIVNKIEGIKTEIKSLLNQYELVQSIVTDYDALVKAEERKFFLGESSLFLINSREQKLIDAQFKQNSITTKQLSATTSLYNALGIVITEGLN